MTEFWERMREQFGPAYADAVARDQVLAKLGGRNAVQALEQGEDPRTVWLALCEHFEIPVRARH
jgi:hypothetical protein